MITPDIELYHFAGLISNVASKVELASKIQAMERATWESLVFIRMRTDVDAALAALEASCNAHPAPDKQAPPSPSPRRRKRSPHERMPYGTPWA